jgi:hypothetical protein
MSPKISVLLIHKNSHEVIRVITNHTRSVQSDRCYQYNNEGADEMILPLFPAFPYYYELLWQHFPLVVLKLLLCNWDQVLHVPPQEVVRKFSGLKEHSRTLHHTPTQHLCIHYSKINTKF